MVPMATPMVLLMVLPMVILMVILMAKTSQPPVSTNVNPPLTSSNAPLAYEPPSFLQPPSHDDEDDEWGDNSEIKIEPTIAPLATYDEETSSPKHNDNHFESYKQIPTENNTDYLNYPSNGENNITNNGNGAATEGNTKLVAVALYDYQAADNDEISFDPNDIITDIVQVERLFFFHFNFDFHTKKLNVYSLF